MNLFDASEFTTQVLQMSPSSIPATLWGYYIQYLWNYESDSWVARIAYSCRILAILVCLPIVILALLDIASYAIARTLGVIDDVKASTSDKATVHSSPQTPSIRVDDAQSPGSDSAFSDSDRESMTDHNLHNRMRSPLSDSISEETEYNFSQPSVFYGEDNNLKLSGVGVFSPAASQPPSPTISRHHLPQDGQLRNREHQGKTIVQSLHGEEQSPS
ncbi:hypothetical protein B0H34DRAFT_351843 [Crassisporium funariophilum]|nr:hypothetical protein B0H34DRAFT_351843 [Crassisporium funariophilum]